MTNGPSMARPDGEAIFAVLRDEILTGVHPPGTPLREVALAERFGVSRTPVREALSRLQHERLLERVSRGLQVPQIDPEQVVRVYDMRVLLEAEAAAQAAQARSITDVLRLEALLERDRGLEDPDDQTRIATNLEFHAAIWAAAHNPVLEDLLERLGTHLVHAPRSTLSGGTRWEEALGEHELMIRAIEARDAEAAREGARAHMETARTLRMQLLRETALVRPVATANGRGRA